MNKPIREKLDKIQYSVRSSQVLYQYGVGGMVDFKDQTLMTAAPEYWRDSELTVIDDERLAKSLQVDIFKMPGSKNGGIIPFVRFPEWYFCPKCNRFKPIIEWAKEYRHDPLMAYKAKDDEFMIKNMNCPKCRQPLIVSRFVTLCNRGHIADFPWVSWAHAKNLSGAKEICAFPELFFKTSASSSGLGGITVECKCGAKASLRDAFNPDEFEKLIDKYGDKYGFGCSGRHPWKRARQSGCNQIPKTSQRGSSSVYYPVTVKSLVIPPYSNRITKVITSADNFKKLTITLIGLQEITDDEELKKVLKKEQVKKFSKIIAEETNIEEAEVLKVLERRFLNQGEEVTPDSIKYKLDEYKALSGKTGIKLDNNGDFQREEMPLEGYGIPNIKQISLITKIKEVRAQIGFTRINPPGKNDSGTDLTQIVNIKDFKTNWYPAYQVFGEGIFIEFDQKKINEWIEQNPEVKYRADCLSKNYKKSFYANSERTITPRFLLLHTISHLLIKQLSYECGYNIASLSERIYSSEEIGDMAGILIYTSDGDSEGTLGGLVRQGRKDTFPSIFKRAIEQATICSNDPVCSLSNGQGRESLNLAACYSCTLIPETSCEEMNILLDRGVVVGTFDNRNIGFYSSQVDGKTDWDSTENVSKTSQLFNNENDLKKKTVTSKLVIKDYGTNLTSFKDVWNVLYDSLNENEKAIIDKIKNSNRFDDLELPLFNVAFSLVGESEEYGCDLIWIKSKLCLFTEENKEEYEKAKLSDYKCMIISGDDFADKLVANLKGNI